MCVPAIHIVPRKVAKKEPVSRAKKAESENTVRGVPMNIQPTPAIVLDGKKERFCTNPYCSGYPAPGSTRTRRPSRRGRLRAPKTAYNWFQLEERERMARKARAEGLPSFAHTAKGSKIIGCRWRALSAKERQRYEAMSEHARIQYEVDKRVRSALSCRHGGSTKAKKRCRKEATLPSPEFLVAAPAKHKRRVDLLSPPFSELGFGAPVPPLMEFQCEHHWKGHDVLPIPLDDLDQGLLTSSNDSSHNPFSLKEDELVTQFLNLQ